MTETGKVVLFLRGAIDAGVDAVYLTNDEFEAFGAAYQFRAFKPRPFGTTGTYAGMYYGLKVYVDEREIEDATAI